MSLSLLYFKTVVVRSRFLILHLGVAALFSFFTVRQLFYVNAERDNKLLLHPHVAKALYPPLFKNEHTQSCLRFRSRMVFFSPFRFHNCLCDNESLSCSVLSPFNDTLQSRKEDTPIALDDDDYINVYLCQFGFEILPNMVCSRGSYPGTCDNDLCYSVCFTNRPSCDIANVSVAFFFNEKPFMRMNAPDTLLEGFCQADEMCSPEKPCAASASKVQRSGRPRDAQFYAANSGMAQEGAPMRPLYLNTDETDCSNVCPASVAMVLLSDKAVATTAALLYVCSVWVC